MQLNIRLLTDADLENADGILKSAFRQGESRITELQLYRKVQPDGWFLALQEGKPAGMVGATNYKTLAYVGMMAVHQEYQRQGIGLALMQHILAWLANRSVPLVLLDASDEGRPLYEKLGFNTCDSTYVMRRCDILPPNQLSPHAQIVTVQDPDVLFGYDRHVFGADRSRLLRALFNAFPGRVFLVRDERGLMAGYLFAQESRIGPWVAESPKYADILLQAALSLPYQGAVSLVVPEVNRDGIDLLRRSGFEIARINRHMGKGNSTSPIERRKIYGQTSLAVG
jgi:ribosomal protein S18 acetylase RimI-like enzyme